MDFMDINLFANKGVMPSMEEPVSDLRKKYVDHPDWHVPMSPYANPDIFPLPKTTHRGEIYHEVKDMSISPIGITLIHHYESLRLEAYPDSGGLYTIGWGTTRYLDGKPVKEGDKITEDEANHIFKIQLPYYENAVKSRIKRNLLQQQFDASVMFCYNGGVGYEKNNKRIDYNLWKHINDNRSPEFIESYWTNLAITAGGKVRGGLVRRRKSESTLYNTGEINFYL